MSQAGRLGALLRRWLFALCLCVLLAILIVLWLGRGGDESHPLLLAIVGVGVVGAALCYSITTRVVAPTRLIVTRQAGWITPSKDYSWLVPFGAYVHDAVTLRAVHRRSRFRFLSSLVDVQIVGATLPGHQGGMAVALRAGKSRTDTVSTRCLRRGLFSLGAIDVSLSDVFGIVRQQDSQATEVVLVGVLPRRISPMRWALPLDGGLATLRASDDNEEMSTKIVLSGEVVVGLRPMRFGEPISWRAHVASARKHQDLALRFPPPRAEETLLILLDLDVEQATDRQRLEDIENAQELLITLAVSLAESALRRTHVPVAFIANGAFPVVLPALSGSEQLDMLLRASIGFKATTVLTDAPPAPALSDALWQADPGAVAVLVTSRSASVWSAVVSSWAQGGFRRATVLAVEGRRDLVDYESDVQTRATEREWLLPGESVMRIPLHLGALDHEAQLLQVLEGAVAR